MIRSVPMGVLTGKPHVISWGWFQMTVANLVVILVMLLVFVAALLLPFPKGKR